MSLSKRERIRRAMELIGEHDIVLHTRGYVEPGYGDDSKYGLVALANWNPPEIKAVAKALEKLGVHEEWSDEWDSCNGCGKLFRTQPDSYGWKRSFVDLDGEKLCHHCACLKKHRKEVLEWFVGKPRTAFTFDFPLEEMGFKRVEIDFENGLYGGQDASPEKIATALRKRNIFRFVFTIDSVGQFDLDFSVWVPKAGWREDLLSPEEAKADEDPASVMKRGLQAAALHMGPAAPGHIKVIKIEGDKAVAKEVSHQDFIDGKALQ